jgi:Binding-protein-dependent transport system inner membrane component
VLLAYLPPAEQELVLARPLPAFTYRTATDPGVLRRELDEILLVGACAPAAAPTSPTTAATPTTAAAATAVPQAQAKPTSAAAAAQPTTAPAAAQPTAAPRFKAHDFVLAAFALGAPRALVLVRHVLPQTIPSVVVSASLGVGFAVLTEAAISYLGLGIQPPTPSWGNMLRNAQQYVWTAPALAILPGLVITLVVLAYNFLGDGLRDAVDPRLHV